MLITYHFTKSEGLVRPHPQEMVNKVAPVKAELSVPGKIMVGSLHSNSRIPLF